MCFARDQVRPFYRDRLSAAWTFRGYDAAGLADIPSQLADRKRMVVAALLCRCRDRHRLVAVDVGLMKGRQRKAI